MYFDLVVVVPSGGGKLRYFDPSVCSLVSHPS